MNQKNETERKMEEANEKIVKKKDKSNEGKDEGNDLLEPTEDSVPGEVARPS